MDAGSIVALAFGIFLTLAGVGFGVSTLVGMAEDLDGGGWLLLIVLLFLGFGIFLICLGAGVVH